MKNKTSTQGSNRKQSIKLSNLINQGLRLRIRVILLVSGILSLFTVAGIIIYFQFAKTENAYAGSQVTLAEFQFQDNLNADAGAIGSPTLTYTNTIKYSSGGVSGKDFEMSYGETGSYFELTMSTANYNNITIQWTGKSTNPGHNDATLALSANSGSGYGSVLYTYTFLTTTWTASSVITLGSAFNKNSQIKLKFAYTTDNKDDLIDNLIVSGTSSLPIELLYFQPKVNDDQVDLTWSTVTEINNNYFTVERSSTGTSFEELLREPGAGNSTAPLTYTAFDPSPIHGISYYRLKQTDYDGRFTYSPVTAIQYGAVKSNANVSIASIGPNPFKNNFLINYDVKEKGAVEIRIIHFSGQLIYKETINADKGFNTWSFRDNQQLPAGSYIVNMISNGETVTKTLIKQ